MPMTRRVACATAILFFSAGLLRAQGELESQVARALTRADAEPLTAVFATGSEIADLGESEAVARVVTQAAAKSGNHGRLAGAVALRALADGDIHGKEILDLLTPIATSKDGDEQAAALSILGDPTLFNKRVLPDVRKLVAERLGDTLATPAAQIEAARALWRVGSESEQLQAKQTLTGFLRSSDHAVSVRSALTLAEFNSDLSGDVGKVLRRAQSEPTADGRLAAAYLQREEERRVFQRRLTSLVEDPKFIPKA